MATEAIIFQQIVDINWDQAIYTASPNNSINVVQFAAKGSGTNIGIALTPKGTGYISAQVPDGTAAGGNARGQNAIDLQLSRTGATSVASGVRAVVIGGRGNDAMGEDSVALAGRGSASRGTRSITIGGYFNVAFGQDSVAIGGDGNYCDAVGAAAVGGTKAWGRRRDGFFHASGMFAAAGDCQTFLHEMRCKTTTNSPVELFIDGASTRLVLTAGSILHATVLITGSKSDGTAVAKYMRQVCIKRVANTTSLVGSVETIGVDEAAGTSISITANDTNEALKLEATGVSGETWRWMASVFGSELFFGT